MSHPHDPSATVCPVGGHDTGTLKECPQHRLPTEPRGQWEALRDTPLAAGLVGATLGGRYVVAGLLGEGGMGAVFRGYNIELRQAVAIKVVLPERANRTTTIERFSREARICATLAHPNTVRVYDFGTLPSGGVYLAMEHLEGQPLDELIASARDAGRTLGPLRAARIARQMALSLAEAHDAGVVHRDLKPGNIFMGSVHGEGDFVKVLDFGIAKLNRESEQGVTTTGVFMGTPAYAAPEQVDAARVDARSDLYSVGIMLYEMLVGRPPFAADSAFKMLLMHQTHDPEPLAKLLSADAFSVAVGHIAMALLEKDPADRMASARDLVDALDRALALAPLDGDGINTLPRAPQAGSRLGAVPVFGWKSAVLALVVVAGLGGAFAALLVPGPEAPRGDATDAGSIAQGLQGPQSPPRADMVRIPAGPAKLGEPLLAVTLLAFDIDRTEVRQSAYAACVRAGACPAIDLFGETGLEGPERPAVMVRWADADGYCRWASKRLPTEAEWARAARATEGRPFVWGDDPVTCRKARHGSEGACARRWPAGTSKVGTVEGDRSAEGVHDLGGNIAEWTADWFADPWDPRETPPDQGIKRVVRGGAYIDDGDWLRASARRAANPIGAFSWLGFRCAASIHE